MAICILDAENNCLNNHKGMQHNGHYAKYAVSEGEKFEQFRQLWNNMQNGTHVFPNSVFLTPSTNRLRRKELALRCIHQGEHLSIPEARQLGLMESHCCGGSFAYQCAIKNHTNLSRCCECNDFQERPINNAKEPTRHLLYHLWPKRMAFGIWQRNLDQLKQRWGLFNGHRVIAVATSSDSATLAQVQEYMRGFDCEWIHVENDPGLREVKTFYALFNAIRNCDGENHFTFYGQGKGATKSINNRVTIHDWTQVMYHTCLDYWPLCEEMLKRYSCIGSFKKNSWVGFTGSTSSWHYSGSFCWIKNKDLFALPDWSRINRDWYGIEAWPSLHFRQEKAGVIFFERKGDFNLYNLGFWKGIQERLKAWKLENLRNRSSIGLLTNGFSRAV